MPFTTLTSTELKHALSNEIAPTLLDVRLASDFKISHLPGAINNPVFEVGFTDRLQDQLPDKDEPICLYGSSQDSYESRMAAEKMHRAGYTKILELREGHDAWKAHHFETVAEEIPPRPVIGPLNDSYEIDVESSRLGWTGRNLLNQHHGEIKIASGHLDFRDGNLASAEIVADLNQITCSDLDTESGHDVLIQHLQDHDFFDVSRYPSATFELNSATAIQGARSGGPNLEISGDLTLRGETHPIKFIAVSGITKEGLPAAQARFAIDRTRWGVLYGSGKFFKNLAGHLVNDEIELDLKLVAKEA